MTVEKQLINISERLQHSNILLMDIAKEQAAENINLSLALLQAAETIGKATNIILDEAVSKIEVDTFIDQINERREMI